MLGYLRKEIVGKPDWCIACVSSHPPINWPPTNTWEMKTTSLRVGAPRDFSRLTRKRVVQTEHGRSNRGLNAAGRDLLEQEMRTEVRPLRTEVHTPMHPQRGAQTRTCGTVRDPVMPCNADWMASPSPVAHPTAQQQQQKQKSRFNALSYN